MRAMKRYQFWYITSILFLTISITGNTGQAGPSRARAGQDDVIRIDTDLVLLNTTVTDGAGRHVPDLKLEDFILKEDGTRRQITHFAAEDSPFAASILIDSSGSMESKLGRARVAASQFAEHMREGDVVSVYSFNSDVEQLQDYSSQRDITPDIWEIEAKGNTRLYDCLYEALEGLGKRKEQRRAVILISDGADTTSRHSSNQILELALQVGATIYAVDIAQVTPGKDASLVLASGILKGLAEKTGGQYIRSAGGQQLNANLLEISKELRSQYTIGFYPDNKTSKERFHKLAVEIASRQGLKVRARQGYKN
jgi:Ca-activated chloride channel homolog